MFERFNRPRPVAWLFFIAAFGFTVAAGTWQVERLAWKRGLIAELAAANAEAASTTLPQDQATLEKLQFRKISVTGVWVTVPGKSPTAIEFHLTPRYLHDQFGYWIISPLKLKDEHILLVNRGWIPGNKKTAETRPETVIRGRATVTGLLRVGAERNYFTPANQPEKNIWFGRDIAEMGAYAKLENIVPAMVDLVGPQDAKHLPVPSDGTIRLRNDHLSYIITWYSIAAGILIIFLVYHRRK